MATTPSGGATPMPVGSDLAVRMFATMVLMRAVEDRMVAMYRGGDLLGSLYSGHWHEAIAVGAAAALRPDDYLAPLHRDLGAHLWRGVGAGGGGGRLSPQGPPSPPGRGGGRGPSAAG